MTPGRLALHEAALIGTQIKAGFALGSYDATGRYLPSPSTAAEQDFEQDLFGAVRVFARGQVALLLPLVETRRTSLGLAETGGGVGDINASARYDFTLAGASRVVPGIALLAGLTLPTGRPPDAPNLGVLATGATGIGAWQINAGLAVEQAYGPWLLNATAWIAQRTARMVTTGAQSIHERLASQWTALAAVGYVLPSQSSIALSLAYAFEGDATIDGVESPATGHRLPTVSVSGALSLSDAWRLQAAAFDNVPISSLGLNQPADLGFSVTLVRSWM